MDRLAWFDYLAIATVLIIRGLISFYFGVNSDTAVSKGSLGWFPVFLSLAGSSLSGVGLIGVPSDAYLNGISYAVYISLGFFLTILLNVYLFIPTLCNLDMESAYEIFLAAIVCYPSATIINQFSSISIETCAYALLVFSTFCTLIGGFKGVIWTDLFQAVVVWIFIGIFVGLAAVRGGGFSRIYNASKASGRLDFFEMSLDPTLRISFWSGTFGLLALSASLGAIHPGVFERYRTLKTEKAAKLTNLLFTIQFNLTLLLLAFCGLGIYASFSGCDIKLVGAVGNYMSTAGYFISQSSNDSIVGLKGIFVVGIIGSSLSSTSSNIYIAAKMLYSEFFKNWASERVSEKASIQMLTLLAGVTSIGFSMLIKGTESIVEVYQSFIGGIGGLSVGLFVLGMLCLDANSTGTFWGGNISLVLISILAVGSKLYANSWLGSPYKAMSTENCSFNVTSSSSPKSPSYQSNAVPWVFRITPYYFSLISLTSTVLFGVLISWLTDVGKTEKKSKLKPELFFPGMRDLFRDRFDYGMPLEEEVCLQSPATQDCKILRS